MARERGPGLNSPSPRNVLFAGLNLAEAPLSDIRLGFRSGFVIEVRDSRRPQVPVFVHSFALNPQRYILSEPHQSTLTPTEDNSVVAEENGYIIREITVEGTFGLSRKQGPSFQGDQGSRTGNEHFIHLRNLFREYARIKQDPKEAAFHYMVFHALRDDDHFIVVPRSFETARDARQQRYHYPYRITFAAIGEATFDTALFRVPFLAELGKDFHTARAFFAEVSARVGTVKSYVRNIETVLGQAADLINAVGETVDGVTELVNYPLELAANVVSDLATATDRLAVSTAGLSGDSIAAVATRNLQRLEAALDRLTAFPERFGPSTIDAAASQYDGEQNLTADDLANRTAGADIGSRTRLALGTAGSDPLDLSGYESAIRERVLATSTIRSFSNRYNVPEELIILVNNLSYPYIAQGGGPGVLKPGDAILIPVPTAPEGPTNQPSGAYLTTEEALYGIDMALDADLIAQEGKFDLLPAQSLDDVDLKRGIDNVIQGTEITVRTDRGSSAYVPEVGIRRSIGLKGTIQHMLLAALNLREGILADPRIEGIDDARITLEDDVLSQEITPRLRGDRSGTNFILPFGTASGG